MMGMLAIWYTSAFGARGTSVTLRHMGDVGRGEQAHLLLRPQHYLPNSPRPAPWKRMFEILTAFPCRRTSPRAPTTLSGLTGIATCAMSTNSQSKTPAFGRAAPRAGRPQQFAPACNNNYLTGQNANEQTSDITLRSSRTTKPKPLAYRM
jgi:hypothetical protein